jgi:3-oxoacyl-[acyl-carrier protein] reductase
MTAEPEGRREQERVPTIERRSGRIINIASVAGLNGGGLLGNSCYAAAKGAVIAFNKGIAREAGPFGITSNVICPALTDTDMTAAMPRDQRRRIIDAIPLNRAAAARYS